MRTWYNADWYYSLHTAWLSTHSSQLTDRLNLAQNLQITTVTARNLEIVEFTQLADYMLEISPITY